MKPYQQRVIDEKNELDKKIKALEHFIASPEYIRLPKGEGGRLLLQGSAMQTYSDILRDRIEAFEPEEISEFEPWLRSVCFKQPTKEAYYLAQSAWEISRFVAFGEAIAECSIVQDQLGGDPHSSSSDVCVGIGMVIKALRQKR